MGFKVRELVLSGLPVADDDRSWMAIIGCGSQSLLLHGNTQKPYIRLDPIDHVVGVKTADDVRALRQELRLLDGRLRMIERELTGTISNPSPPEPTEDAAEPKGDPAE